MVNVSIATDAPSVVEDDTKGINVVRYPLGSVVLASCLLKWAAIDLVICSV